MERLWPVEYRAAVAEWCGERVVLARELAAAKPHGPFWLILDSLGGAALGAALGMLQPGGTCVTFGVSEAASTTFESRNFFATGGVRLYGLTLFHELMSVERAGIGLGLLADLIGRKEVAAADRRRSLMERDRHGRPPAYRSRVHRQSGAAHPLRVHQVGRARKLGGHRCAALEVRIARMANALQ